MNILVCGDSHSNIFKYCNNKQKEYIFDVKIVSGATAQGAVNPNSKTNALNIFTNKINNSKHDKLLIMLGEVDCGFVIWVRSKKYNISVDEQIKNSINNLFKFLKNIQKYNKYKNQDIILAGAPLPTIKDSTNKKFLMGQRSEVNVSQLKRTKKTLEYNKILKNKCKRYSYHYIDINKYIIDKNIVNDKYLNKDPYDHHLDKESTYIFWLNELKKILN